MKNFSGHVEDLRRNWKRARSTGFIHLLTSNVATRVLAFLMIIAVARFLSPADVGRVNIMLAVFAVLVAIANFGTTTSILKLCSEDISEADLLGFFFQGTLLNVVTSLLTYSIAVLIVLSRIVTNDPALIGLLPWFLLALLSSTMNNYFFAYFQSRQQIRFISKLQASLKSGALIMVIIGLYFWRLRGFVFGYLLGDFISLGVYLLFVGRRTARVKVSLTRERFRKVFHLSKYGAFANQLGQLLQYLDTMVMSMLRVDLAGIGFYSIAQYFILGANQVTYTMSQVAVPRLSFHSGDIRKWGESYSEYERIFRRITLGVSVGLLIFGPLVILLFLKPAFRISILFLFILIVGFWARSYSAPKSIATWSLGRLDYNFFSSFAASGLNLVLNIVLIISFGVFGAASATSLAYILSIPFFSHFLKKEVNRRRIADLNWEEEGA